LEETYKFKFSGITDYKPVFSISELELAVQDDKNEILEADFFDDEYEVDRFINDPSIYLYRINGSIASIGSLLPAYWRDDLNDDRIREVGMYVAPKYRKKGFGKSMVYNMTQLCLSKNYIPIAECVISNKASRATLESAGYVLDPKYNK